MCSVTIKKQSFLERFYRDEGGVAFIEFVFMLPVFIIIFYGLIEVSRLIQMHQKMGNAAHAVTDLINQNFNISNALINEYASTLPALVSPFDSEGVGMIVTAIEVPLTATQPITAWQRESGKVRSSRISGGQGAVPTLPSLSLVPGDQVIAVEIFLDYRPILDNDTVRTMLGISPEGVYKVSIARPRFGAFNLPPA
jgi:hypothetical protein